MENSPALDARSDDAPNEDGREEDSWGNDGCSGDGCIDNDWNEEDWNEEDWNEDWNENGWNENGYSNDDWDDDYCSHNDCSDNVRDEYAPIAGVVTDNINRLTVEEFVGLLDVYVEVGIKLTQHRDARLMELKKVIRRRKWQSLQGRMDDALDGLKERVSSSRTPCLYLVGEALGFCIWGWWGFLCSEIAADEEIRRLERRCEQEIWDTYRGQHDALVRMSHQLATTGLGWTVATRLSRRDFLQHLYPGM